MIISANLDATNIINALARLKGISVSKVVRNASRDFAQASMKETPVAKISKSEFYKFTDRLGRLRFLHESQLHGKRKKGSKLKKVRIYRFWSKASWLGIFRALGVSLRLSTNRLPSKVERISNAITSGSDSTAKTIMTDYIHFDAFGNKQDTRTQQIARAGFALAAKRISSEVNKMLIRQWTTK